jgi:hypothetical protein
VSNPIGPSMSMQPHSSDLTIAADAVAAGLDLKSEVGHVSEVAIVGAGPVGTVTGVTYMANAAIAGANSNTRNVQLVNVTQGNLVVANLQFNSGVNAAEGVETLIALSGTPANLNVNLGDVLEWQSLHVGAGLADPGGLVRVTITRTTAKQ